MPLHPLSQRLAECPAILYPFIRTKAHNPKHGDCTIRAISQTTGLDYELVLNELIEEGYSPRLGFDITNWVQLMKWNDTNYHGFEFNWKVFQAQKDMPRMNPVRFCELFREGDYICRTAGHVFAVCEGIVFDTWKQNNARCIYGAWKVERI